MNTDNSESAEKVPETFECSLPETILAPMAEATITTARVSPRGPLHPVTLQIDPELADHLQVQDVKVGRNSQLAGAGSLPGTLFSRDLPARPIICDSIPPGLSLSVRVTNTSPGPVNFRGKLVVQREKPANIYMPLGFGVTKMAAMTTMSIVARSQLVIRPAYLHVPPRLLEHFTIRSLTTESYLDDPNTSGTPGEQLTRESLLADGQLTFAPLATLSLDDSVVLVVTNHSPQDRLFTAVLLGLLAS